MRTRAPGRCRPFALAHLRPALVLVAALAAPGCGRQEPLNLKVSAPSPSAFAAWRSQAAGTMGPELAREFDDAVQEIRLRLEAVGLPEGAADDDARKAIDGRNIRQVLLQGFGWRLERLEYERSQIERTLGKADLRGPMPADHASEGYLSELRARQEARLKEVALEIAAARARLASARDPEERDGGAQAAPFAPSTAPVPPPSAAAKD